jgi:capsular polysaccharide transport system permease protein
MTDGVHMSVLGKLQVQAKKNPIFMAVVFVPTLLSAIYYGVFASDVYISESKFVVHTVERQTESPLSSMLKGVGLSKSLDGAHSIHEYVLSRDAMAELDANLGIKKKFSAQDVDRLSRFDGFGFGNGQESFLRYYRKMAGVQVDSAASVVTLVTKAFSPGDAHEMNRLLLGLSEGLVNRLNHRAQQDMIQFSLREVEKALARDKAAALALASYRNEKGVIDPEKQSTIPLQQVAHLQDQLVATKIQIRQLESLAPASPQLPALRQQEKVLQDEIGNAEKRVANGGGDASLATKAAKYQQLQLEKDFSAKLLASALSSLEQAKNDAQRQQVYLERIAQPSLPDEPMEPRRLRAVLSVLGLGLLVWGILEMLVAGMREHKD